MALFNWFKKKADDEQAEEAPVTPPPPAPNVTKPGPAPIGAAPGQTPPVVTRTARTVMPNTVRPVSLRGDTAKPQIPSARPAPVMTRPISMPGISPAAPVAAPPPPEEIELAPPVPVEPSPTMVGKTIALELGDFLDRIPGSFLKQGPFDLKRRIEFQATDLYSDLSRGRASVPVSIISRTVPDIFAKQVSETEDVEIQLPLQKLVEQIGDFQTRTDQIAPEQVAEIETPFLQVAKEDLAKFPGKGPVAPPVAAVPPPAPVAPPPAPVAPPPAPVAPPPAPIPVAVAPPPAPAIAPPPVIPAPMAIPAPAVPPPVAAIPAAGPAPVQPAGPLAPPTRRTAAPIIPGKRPPATVRASVSGGKIRLSGPAIPARISPAQPGAAAPTAPTAPVAPPPLAQPGVPPPPPVAPAPATALKPAVMKPIPAPPSGPVAPPQKEEKKVTRRIQIPGIQLKKPDGTPGTATPVASTPPPSATPPPPPSLKVPGAFPMPAAPAPIAPPPAPVAVTPPPPPVAAPVPAAIAPTPMSMPKPPGLTPSPVAIPSAETAPVQVGSGQEIGLNLKAILRALPGDAVSGDLDRIDDNAQVVFPFSVVEKQLPTGRVAIPIEIFVPAMPAELRRIFQGADPEAEVPIPLQEIFQSLPSDALKLRTDQVVEHITEEIPTPFSQKATEDAERFKAPPEPEPVAEAEAPAPVAEPEPEPAPVVAEVPPPAPEPAAETVVQEVPPAPVAAELPKPPIALPPPVARPNIAPPPPVTFAPPPAPVAPPPAPEPIPAPVVAEATPSTPLSMPAMPPPPLQTIPAETPTAAPSKTFDPSILQAIFMSEDAMDAKIVAKKVSELPAIKGCLIMFGDGLTLAGNFPAEYDTPGICAMAPLLFKKIDTYAQDLKLGSVQTFTVFADQSPISFFQHDNLCLSVLHGTRGFLPGIREKLVEVTRELSKMYSEINGS